MMDVYWLEHTYAEVPARNDWLSAGEMDRLHTLHIPKRCADWRLGRWTGKRALAACAGLSGSMAELAAIELRPAKSGAPQVFINQKPAPIVVSLSHREGRAFCAVAHASAALGCDLELIESRSDAFIADYFTADEQALMQCAPAGERHRLATLLWSAKESALKALHAGLLLDTRSVTVVLSRLSHHGGWSPLHVNHADGQRFHGWWRCSGDLVRTVVAAPRPSPPVALDSSFSSRQFVSLVTANDMASAYGLDGLAAARPSVHSAAATRMTTAGK